MAKKTQQAAPVALLGGIATTMPLAVTRGADLGMAGFVVATIAVTVLSMVGAVVALVLLGVSLPVRGGSDRRRVRRGACEGSQEREQD